MSTEKRNRDNSATDEHLVQRNDSNSLSNCAFRITKKKLLGRRATFPRWILRRGFRCICCKFSTSSTSNFAIIAYMRATGRWVMSQRGRLKKKILFFFFYYFVIDNLFTFLYKFKTTWLSKMEKRTFDVTRVTRVYLFVRINNYILIIYLKINK